ncbi:trimeric LpxA-like protein [Phyllosticta citrichinensis]|uniref:Dynactin subunit 5 n=1 Tax=Phyllosticta citrichinensis TaxID=1130410 RepID=A0ABR1XQ85_9PEZI
MSSRPSATRKAAKGEYIETDSGNKVSRRAHISGTANITLGGKTVIQSEVVLRGDLHRLKTSSSTTSSTQQQPSSSQHSNAISIGRCTIISPNCTIRPPARVSRGLLSHYPMKIGDNVFIGPHCRISAASISSHVHVGAHAVLEPFCLIRDNVKILPHSVVPANMVVPSNSVVGGRPARVVAELGEGWGVQAGGGVGGAAAGAAATSGAPGEAWVEGGDLRELVRSIR